MSTYYDYDDYHSITDNSDELYSYDDDDQWDYDNNEVEEQNEWENYYHNITDEIVED
jgi:hypothetical protein